MFKGNSFAIVFAVVILLFIIFSSTQSLIVRILFILLSILFLIPAVRKILFTNYIVLRKLKVSLFTSLTFTFGLFLIESLSAFNETAMNDFIITDLMFIIYFSLFFILIYGLPVSMIAEFISTRIPYNRALVSGIIHVGFGLMTFLISIPFDLMALICSVIFFALDEISRRKL
ncbi:hypothetical protein [Cytobacillus oceanisediminis]|uniref:Uncharacterized protein n=1 Tax=Cytobacillus oceanisediminis 2691 TaxID=1196031 RepID=A0A160MGA9_9BACI|nr:hypothetical protein [Cytobacillus oceanisediminis]AND42270.1 hypothetical protein A361_25005 [Cytobacillus oceanisediminis 2691]